MRAPGWKFFRGGEDHAERAELFRRTTPQIQLEKGRRGDEECDAVAAHESADGRNLEGRRNEHDGCVCEHDEPEDEITERVEEWENPEDFFVVIEMKHLADS